MLPAVSDSSPWLDPALRPFPTPSRSSTSPPILAPTLALTSPSPASNHSNPQSPSGLITNQSFAELPSRPNCWALVLARSQASANAFVYCVTTTRIYCRPTCPSRRPNFTNVVFYKTGSEAVANGFRACLRCKPEEASDPAERRQREAVDKAKEVIQDRVRNGGKIGLEELSQEVGVSAFHLHRLFKKQVGVTPESFAKQAKVAVGGGHPVGRSVGKKQAKDELSCVAHEMVSSVLLDLDFAPSVPPI